MNIGQLLAWSTAIPQLIAAGIMVENQVAGVLKSFHSTLSDSELNAIAALIIAGAVKHQTIANKDAGV